MLDVTGCTCPTGILWRGVYDSTGVQYKVPEWVVVEPEGLADDVDDHHDLATGSKDVEQGVDADDVLDDKDETVRVQARTSHNQRDVTIMIRKKETVNSVVEKLKKQAKVRHQLLVMGLPIHSVCRTAFRAFRFCVCSFITFVFNDFASAITIWAYNISLIILLEFDLRMEVVCIKITRRLRHIRYGITPTNTFSRHSSPPNLNASTVHHIHSHQLIRSSTFPVSLTRS